MKNRIGTLPKWTNRESWSIKGKRDREKKSNSNKRKWNYFNESRCIAEMCARIVSLSADWGSSFISVHRRIFPLRFLFLFVCIRWSKKIPTRTNTSYFICIEFDIICPPLTQTHTVPFSKWHLPVFLNFHCLSLPLSLFPYALSNTYNSLFE